MNTNNVDIQSRFVNALRTQRKTEPRSAGEFPCPYGHSGRVFQNADQLWAHTNDEHETQIFNMEPSQARAVVQDMSLKLRKSDQSLGATAGGRSTPDINSLSLNADRERKTSPPSGRKRRAVSDINTYRKARSPGEVADPETLHVVETRPRPQESRLYDHKKSSKRIGPTSQSQKINRTIEVQSHTIAEKQMSSGPQLTSGSSRQPGIIELPKYDDRYPGLLLQPDSRPISQEQLASEVKSIYAGLTMVESKCGEVDTAQAEARRRNPDQILPSEHWQALIALHRTLLHEHHDFFLASQHPSASPALRRLAAKYNMPGRMWRIGIHPFLEELRVQLPHSLDHMIAFIYLTYQMVALLYETVPAFEDTWMECLGDLGRYRMAIQNKDVQDRETWSSVARSWYLKASDKNPLVGRLHHHLAILAQSSALQQLHYYAMSLTCFDPFPSARESILNLLDAALARRKDSNVSYAYTNAISIEAYFVKAHAHLYDELSTPGFETASLEFTTNLDNHIGRVTAKWKEQGVHVAVSNIAAWFSYGLNLNIFRQIFLLRAERRRPAGEKPSPAPKDPQEISRVPQVTESQIPSLLNAFVSTPTFSKAVLMTNDTFALVLRRIGDQNVLPHIHVMLSFLTTLASTAYVIHPIDQIPWNELVSFLNTLIKIETRNNQNQDVNALLMTSVFPDNSNVKERDEYPLPEDYQMRGLIWAQEYFPAHWFEREHDEGDRNLELPSTARSRISRVLRLGYVLSTFGRWTSYDISTHTFSIIGQ